MGEIVWKRSADKIAPIDPDGPVARERMAERFGASDNQTATALEAIRDEVNRLTVGDNRDYQHETQHVESDYDDCNYFRSGQQDLSGGQSRGVYYGFSEPKAGD